MAWHLQLFRVFNLKRVRKENLEKTLMSLTIEKFESITNEQLKKLSGPRESLCVSVYLPTHRKGVEVQQDPIRLKNALKAAKAQLKDLGVTEEQIDALVKPVLEIAEEEASSDFWQHQSDGLAILSSSDELILFQLPVKFNELVAVSDRFALKPLIRAVTTDRPFHIVAVSRKKIRVFCGSPDSLTEEHFDDIPEGLSDIGGEDDEQKGQNKHSVKVRTGGEDSSVPHGHSERHEKAELQQYFRSIKEAVGDHLRSHASVVVFAGVAELFPYFREEFNCCEVLDQPVSGNHDQTATSELHEKAWPIVQAKQQATIESEVAQYAEVSHTERGISDLSSILNAAFQGQIGVLLLSGKQQNYGTCDANGMLESQDQPASASTYDLLDVAALKVLEAEGRVIFVDGETLNSQAAAVLRYTI